MRVERLESPDFSAFNGSTFMIKRQFNLIQLSIRAFQLLCKAINLQQATFWRPMPFIPLANII